MCFARCCLEELLTFQVCYGDGNFVHVCFASSQAATRCSNVALFPERALGARNLLAEAANACLALNGQLLLGKLMAHLSAEMHSKIYG